MDVAGFRLQGFRLKTGEKHIPLDYDEVKNASRVIAPSTKMPDKYIPLFKGERKVIGLL